MSKMKGMFFDRLRVACLYFFIFKTYIRFANLMMFSVKVYDKTTAIWLHTNGSVTKKY